MATMAPPSSKSASAGGGSDDIQSSSPDADALRPRDARASLLDGNPEVSVSAPHQRPIDDDGSSSPDDSRLPPLRPCDARASFLDDHPENPAHPDAGGGDTFNRAVKQSSPDERRRPLRPCDARASFLDDHPENSAHPDADANDDAPGNTGGKESAPDDAARRRPLRPRDARESYADGNPEIDFVTGGVGGGGGATTTNNDAAAPLLLLPPTLSLPLLNMLDMFAVSLVVPLLHQYYRTAGVSSARQREFLSSLYSSSQIVGGLILGGLTDGNFISRRTVLFVSFAGSAVSYGLIVTGGFRELVISRVVVGLVKQTMTVTTAMMARHTTVEERPTHMGRLSASTTVAWIIGPSAGALLYKHVGPSAPAVCASLLFVLNSFIAATVLPKDEDDGGKGKGKGKEPTPAASSSTAKFASFASNLRSCFSCAALGSAILSLLLFSWVTRATSYASMGSYYEELYGLEPHQRGYVSSYQQLLNFGVQSVMVKPLLASVGGDERKAACLGAIVLTGATALELCWSNLYVFGMVVCPLVAVSVSMLGLSLRSLVTKVAPRDSLGSVLAALDVMQSAANVTTPFYRAFLFEVLGRVSGHEDEDATMRGDPDPYVWLASSVVHWLVLTAALAYLLLWRRGDAPAEKKDKEA